MDGAAKRVKKLVQHVLPDRPHHLSISPTRRYREPRGFWPHDSGLQYSTFVSEADRGILLTRPYYDIHEDDDEPTNKNGAMNATNVAKGDVKKPGTKMSFKDYQQAKQKKISASPPDTGSGHAKAAPESRLVRSQDVSRSAKDAEKPPARHHHEPEHREPHRQNHRTETNGDRAKSPTRIPPKPLRSPISESRKRAADSDDTQRPLKRSRADSYATRETPRSEPVDTARKRAVTDSYDRRPNDSARSSVTHREVNGKSAVDGARDAGRHVSSASPRPGANGVRDKAAHSSHLASRQQEHASKPAVPPLLSPLRLSLDESNDVVSKSPRKRPAENGDNHLKPPLKIHKADASKRAKSPLRLPPLLSPTLPPIVEEELARVKATPGKGDSSQLDSQASDSPGSGKKVREQADTTTKSQGDSQSRAPPASSLIVVLKYKKRNVKRVQRLLALQPMSQKEALRKERSMSVEGTPPPPFKRRPVDVAEALPAKHPRSTADKTVSGRSMVSDKTVSGRSAAPSTPLKPTAMSRAASSNSQAHTPGDMTSQTPGGERPPTSHGEPPSTALMNTLHQRHQQFLTAGTRLKHDRDAVIRPKANGVAKGEPIPNLSNSDRKRVAALSFEMVVAYMTSFRALNRRRALERKPSEYKPYEDLVPHLNELRRHARSFPPVEALAMQLQAVCLEQLTETLADPRHPADSAPQLANRLAKWTRERANVWSEAQRLRDRVEEDGLRVSVGPWHSVEEAVSIVMPIMRRWAHRADANWQQSISLPPPGA